MALQWTLYSIVQWPIRANETSVMQGAKHGLKPVKVEFIMDLVVIYNMVRSLLVLGHWCVIPIKTLMEHFLGIGHVNYLSSLTKISFYAQFFFGYIFRHENL